MSEKQKGTAMKCHAPSLFGPWSIAPSDLSAMLEVVRALDLARLVGMTDLAPVGEIYDAKFKPVPTKK